MSRTDEEKDYAFDYAKKIADKFDAEKYLNTPRPYPVTLAQKMQRPFDAPPVIVNFFYHEEVRKSAKKGDK